MFRTIFITLLSFAIAGCAGAGSRQLLAAATPGIFKDHPENQYCNLPFDMYFAQPLCAEYSLGNDAGSAKYTAAYLDTAGTPDQRVAYIAEVLSDSRTKCQMFIGQFTGLQSAENTSLDIASLVLSGLGSVLTPANTVRALSAGSTAVQGTKQAINADLFQQITMLLLVQQINATYYQALNAAFPSEATSGGPPAFPPIGAELATFRAAPAFQKIVDIHKNCSIPFSAASISQAQKTLSQTLNLTDSKAKTVAVAAITISGSTTKGDALNFVILSASKNIFSNVSCSVAASGEPQAQLYANCATAVNENQTLKNNQITAIADGQQLTIAGPADVSLVHTESGVGGKSATEAVHIVMSNL
jgi:hypothetical protein